MLKHGHTAHNKVSPTYHSWWAMRCRCYNKNVKEYAPYGGAGVRVCKRWASFLNFLADMGERPEGKTLGRFRDKGNYTPSNCAWMTRQEQEAEKWKNRNKFCKHGHPRTPENTKAVYSDSVHGQCKVCDRINAARYRKRRNAQTSKR
jgi:hypothetical protein